MKISDTHCSLNIPNVPAAEQAEAYLAWKRGEAVQVLSGNGGAWLPMTLGMVLTEDMIIRRKPSPSLRPWTGVEVPLGAWMRIKGPTSDFVTTIQGRSSRNLWLGGASVGIDFAEALRDYEHSINLGVTWNPCGIGDL